MWQRLQEVMASWWPVGYDGLTDSEKITAIAAFSQTVAAVLSACAILLSLWVFSRQQKIARWQLRLHREDHIIAWSRSCVVLLAEIEEAAKAHRMTGTELLPHEQFLAARSRLSALIDEGRLYFPNIKSRTHGKDKHDAFKGHRQKILDPLVAFYDRMKVIQYDPAEVATEEKSKALNAHRRAFISEAQHIIDPRRFNRVRA